MLDDIQRINSEFDAALASANTAATLDELRVHYFGRKGGLIPALFSRLKEVPKEQKKDAGDALNKLRDRLESELKEKHERIAAEESKRKESRDIIDVTLPPRLPNLGHLHPVTIIIAVMAGTTLLGGLLGGILAIPLTAALRVVMFRYVWERPKIANLP